MILGATRQGGARRGPLLTHAGLNRQSAHHRISAILIRLQIGQRGRSVCRIFDRWPQINLSPKTIERAFLEAVV